jgi:hypothetical protein
MTTLSSTLGQYCTRSSASATPAGVEALRSGFSQPVTASHETLPLSHAAVTAPAASVSVRPTR